ncbi:MAG: hypothetical protein Kow0079_06470 [Vicingaceae bacterium]
MLNMKKIVISTLLFTGIIAIKAQTPVLVADIYPGSANSMPDSLIVLGNDVFFQADNGTNGKELWNYDGTTGTASMVADINPGSGGSAPTQFMVLGSDLFFQANNGTNGSELWKYDGSSGTVSMVADINPGSGSSSPSDLTVLGGDLYFFAYNINFGRELWKYDGTSGTVSITQDIFTGPGSSHPTYVSDMEGNLVAVGSDLFFSADDGTNDFELWKYDGTTGTASMVADINPSGSSFPHHLAALGNDLLFAANDMNGTELWKYDGTSGMVNIVQDINPGGANSSPYTLTEFGNDMFFYADNGTNGVELWKYDGTFGTASMVQDIFPGSGSSQFTTLLENLIVAGNNLFFGADDGTNGFELWRYNGFTGTVSMVSNINLGPAYSYPHSMTLLGNELFFGADNGTNGSELWKYDLTTGFVSLVYDINPGSAASFPNRLTVVGSDLIFAAGDATNGYELWKLGSGSSCTNTSSTISPTACNSYTSPSGNYTWTTSGTYMDTIPNAAGCDSIITIQLTISNNCTQLMSQYCGITLPNFTTYIKCNYVSGATEYEYEVSNNSLGYIQTKTRVPAYRHLYLNNVPGIQPNTTYDIRVRAKVGGVYGSYGPVCQVTTPNTPISTQLEQQYCDTTLSSYSQYIRCDYFENATEYMYEIKDGATLVDTVTRNANYRHLYLNTVSGIQDGVTYTIRVRAKRGGTWTPYGSACTVTTPSSGATTQLRSKDCDKVLSSFSKYIMCDYVSGATKYMYEIKNGSTLVDTVTRNANYRFIYLNTVNGIQTSTLYDIRVRAYVNGTWTNYGKMCQVRTPSSFRVGQFITENNTENSIENVSEFNVYPNPSKGYHINVQIDELPVAQGNGLVEVYDLYGRKIQSESVDVNNGYINTIINFNNKLETGFYLIKVQVNDKVYSKKLIVE